MILLPFVVINDYNIRKACSTNHRMKHPLKIIYCMSLVTLAQHFIIIITVQKPLHVLTRYAVLSTFLTMLVCKASVIEHW